ncbi:MAG: hypothetical protein ABI614_07320 [Planctomycetota bacterium]
MKNLLWLVCLAIVSSSAVDAQDAVLSAPRSDDGMFMSRHDAPNNHEAGYPRYESPRQLVVRNAALKAAQRHERMAINASFGYSPSRPPSSTVPSMGAPMGPPTAFRVYSAYPGFIFPRPYSRN